MENFKKKLKQPVKDQIAVFAIIIAICITVLINGVIYTILNSKSISTGNVALENKNQLETSSIENLTSVENVNSLEELKKINEKELEEAKKKEKEENKEVVSTPKYYIKVNYGAQVVTIYTKDSKGKYTKPVKAMVCSTGTYTPTSGVYKTPNRFRWLDMVGDVYAQYCTQIVGDILFHSVPYRIKYDKSSLIYTAYDNLGLRVSLGCVRLTCEDAKWIYDNCKLGTSVEFYSSSNPGPLGKPSARKISNAPKNIRGWDPTDPDSDNPWNDYLKQQANKNNSQNKDTNKNQNTDKNNNKGNASSSTNKKPEQSNENDNSKNEQQNEIVNEIINEVVNETVNEVINIIDEPDINMVNEQVAVNSI